MEVVVRSWPVDVVVDKRVIRLYVDYVQRGGGHPFYRVFCPNLCPVDRCNPVRPSCAARASVFVVPCAGGGCRVFFSWDRARLYAAKKASELARQPFDP
jgi:hypothetical protein